MPSQTSGAASPRERAVIRAKVGLPPLSDARADRPRVEALLADLIERHRTVLVAATAGAGKTTAVAAATSMLDRPLAWLTLDWSDAAPGRLVTYLEAALARPLPRVAGIASEALAARIPHPEAAGLLVEAAGEEPVVLVIDELERVAESSEAWAVLEAVLRYAPADMRVVLVSRRELPGEVLAQTPRDIASLGEAALAFTPAEAAEALRRLGEAAVDATAAVEATGGWVTGVLFEAWRSAEHVAGSGGEADPLHGYLSAHIVGRLPAEDRDFLIGTSVLDDVTPSRAVALGHDDAAERLASLRAVHLPVSWRDGGRTLRCHPRFREYLLECLERRGADEVRAVRLAHGRLLAREGDDEGATEELLAAGAHEEALATAGRVIFGVIDRLDLAVAERWLEALGRAGPLVMAELMLALAREDYGRGAALADDLAAAGTRAPLAAASSAAALLMGLCYAHLARVDDMRAVFAEAEAEPDADLEVMRYFMAIYEPDPSPRPALTGGPLDALVLAVDFGYGRLAELLAEQTVGWVNAWSQPWLISALSATGHTQEAVELYEQVRAHGLMESSIDTVVGPHVLVDAGRRAEALAAIARGRRRARAGGSVVYELLADLSEARLVLRLDRDPDVALSVLDRLERTPYARGLAYLAEQIDAWYGFALLLAGRDEEAAERLRRAVAAMVRSQRMLELPTAAVYLAEAEWRLGDEEAADRAADFALDAARRQGSNHMLLQALADFPAVVSRRIDAEPVADSPWHELGRALIAQDVAVEAPVHASVRLIEFGACTLLVNGEQVRPRIVKTYELLAYLAARSPDARADRGELLDALFEGRADESSRAYLRQAVRWLRQVLPEGSVHVEKGHVRLGDEVVITSESTRFERALAQAARLRGGDRLAATLAALEMFDRGPYLPGVVSRWVDERRERLTELATDARYEAAELAFAEGQLGQAKRLVAEVLRAEPYREAAWRLTMRLAGALGDDDGVLRAFQRCEQELAAVGASPGPTTRQLLERLRR